MKQVAEHTKEQVSEKEDAVHVEISNKAKEVGDSDDRKVTIMDDETDEACKTDYGNVLKSQSRSRMKDGAIEPPDDEKSDDSININRVTESEQRLEKSESDDSQSEISEKKTDHVDQNETISKLEKSLEEQKDKLLRVSAEFENFKRRSRREIEDFRKFSNEMLLKDLLPSIDNLERAIMSSDTDDSCIGIVEGVSLTLKEILKTFSQFGVEPVDSLEKPFDPLFHQAVGQEENDQLPPNTVIKELQKGYTIHNRLLRPAMVLVSIQTKNTEGEKAA